MPEAFVDPVGQHVVLMLVGFGHINGVEAVADPPAHTVVERSKWTVSDGAKE